MTSPCWDFSDAPSQFQPVLTMVGRACESIASSKKLEADTRRLGMELMLTLSETAGTMVRKCKPMVHTMIKLAFTMMEEAPVSTGNLLTCTRVPFTQCFILGDDARRTPLGTRMNTASLAKAMWSSPRRTHARVWESR